MKKALLVLLILSVGFAGGWVVSGVSQNGRDKSKDNNAPPVATKSTERFVDISSGEGMAPSEMYAELQKRSGKDFDSQYIAYVIVMQNNLTGINRLAKEKAQDARLRDKAEVLWQYDSQLTPELYALQKSLGYAHH